MRMIRVVRAKLNMATPGGFSDHHPGPFAIEVACHYVLSYTLN